MTVREVTPVATASAQQPWWEWADQKIDAAISVEHEFVMEIMGGALGECMRNLREPLEREDSALKREVKLLRRELATLREEVRVERGLRDLRLPLEQDINVLRRELELLRREFTVLQEQVGLERGLRDLRDEVAEARKQMPQVPAIAERLRAEANIARVDITTEQAQLRHDLEATKRTVSVLRARHSNTDFNLGRFMRSMQNVQANEIEYESASERMIIRQRVHPGAAKALKEFAATVLDNDGDVVH